MTDFEQLLRGFSRHKKLAEELRSPDPEDDLFVRMAIVGFSFHRPTEEWGIDNLNFIRRYRGDEFSGAALAELGLSNSHALFACLSLGHMLGLFQAGQIDETEFSRGEALLPGFLALNEEEITSMPA